LVRGIKTSEEKKKAAKENSAGVTLVSEGISHASLGWIEADALTTAAITQRTAKLILSHPYGRSANACTAQNILPALCQENWPLP